MMNIIDLEKVNGLVQDLDWIRDDSNFVGVKVTIYYANKKQRRDSLCDDIINTITDLSAPVLNSKRKEFELAVLTELKALGVNTDFEGQSKK